MTDAANDAAAADPAHIPDGFARHFRPSRVTDPWEPLFSRVEAEAVAIGLRIGPAHCNSRGLLHGGVIAALADNAMGLTLVQAQKTRTGADIRPLTVSLNVDYLASAKEGAWLEIRPRMVRIGRRLGFADCLALADGDPTARASASFALG